MVLLAGCVALHAPLRRDETYPKDWADPMALSGQCQDLDGTYSTAGVSVGPDRKERALSLLDVLAVRSLAPSVSLRVTTRRVDDKGDTFATLLVTPGDDAGARREIATCYCIRRTLACTQLSETSWAVPNFGFGGRQSNLFATTAADRSLILRLQDYRIDVMLGIPLFRNAEPWARFPPFRPGPPPPPDLLPRR